MGKSELKTKQIAIDAMMAAMCALLGYIALDFGTMKITVEELPVILTGLMYGPVDGMLVGAIGTLIYQILRYGFSVTTVLWILPYIVAGQIAGLYAKKHGYYNSRGELIRIAFFTELAILVFNTLAIYVDSKLFGYYSVPYVWGALFTRAVIAAAKAVVIGIVLLPILKVMGKYTRNGKNKKK